MIYRNIQFCDKSQFHISARNFVTKKEVKSFVFSEILFQHTNSATKKEVRIMLNFGSLDSLTFTFQHFSGFSIPEC